MSMASGFGAAAAAAEILAEIDKEWEKHKEENNNELKVVLHLLANKCREIIKAGNDGWY